MAVKGGRNEREKKGQRKGRKKENSNSFGTHSFPSYLISKDGEAVYSQQKQDQEVTVAQIMSSLLPNSDNLKKVGKTAPPFKYDQNQIPYDYTVEVRNRFNGLDLIDR